MNAENFDVDALVKMAHSPVRNYVIPGLTSWLIGNPGPHGTVRLFINSRDHQESICPHSHRFDFQCWVLRGGVTNRVWTEQDGFTNYGDLYCSTVLKYQGDVGKHETMCGRRGRWDFTDTTYTAGSCYSMKSEQVHSIKFSNDAMVLFFEGPQVSDESIVLQPIVDGLVIPTFKVEPWMFRK